MMSYSRRSRYSCSPSPYGHHNRSAYRSLSRSRSRSRSHDSSDVENPGNNLYVTGLSPRITKKELEKHFSSEGGKVIDVHLVADPWTRESRGFGFVTMSTLKEADRCIKYLNRSVLEGRVITVEKARRRRGRTPTPGRYLGIRTVHVRRRSPNYSPYHRSRYSSPGYSSEQERDRSYSPCYSQRRSPSRFPTPYIRSPVGRRDRYFSRYDYYNTCEHSISPYHRRRRYRSISRSPSPRGRSYSRSIYLRPRRSSRRSYSRSISPRRRSRRNYSPSISPRRSYSRSASPRVSYRNSRRNISPSVSPRPTRSKRSISESESPSSRRYSRNSYSRGYSRSRSVSSRSRSVSRSPSPASRSTSPSN